MLIQMPEEILRMCCLGKDMFQKLQVYQLPERRCWCFAKSTTKSTQAQQWFMGFRVSCSVGKGSHVTPACGVIQI